ncbi:hypothetical protein [Luteipulveratus halotolerans]|uniref:Uncharacterized protein n=1 Tax=Luteipulveratus halotolerans TaxID=1631356 RepID=A0A0L6CMN1_9MICO|nr:hypothetical protein [Luteipulveratus halotolerans]KNX38920.1 hypothetical protein VV01_20170 [Luteipulveratus halotolerans]
MRDVFHGQILGVGSTSGVRVVVGRWLDSPLGAFADVMVADATGRRTLLAPTAEVADYVTATYTFDAVRQVPVTVSAGPDAWSVDAGPLQLTVALGGRTPLGRLLSVLPPSVAHSPALASLTDPVARVVLRGVRTRGTAGNGRREFYGATDQRAVTEADGSWDGTPLGRLAPVWPEPSFGFSSTPRRPSLVTLATTVDRTR